MVDRLKVSKTNFTRLVIYSLVISVPIVFFFIQLIFAPDLIFGMVICCIAVFVLGIFLIDEYFKRVLFLHKDGVLTIRDGLGVFDSVHSVKVDSIAKCYARKYTTSRGGGKKSGPYTYDHPFDNSSNISFSYSVELLKKNRERVEFGEYMTLDSAKEVLRFIDSLKGI